MHLRFSINELGRFVTVLAYLMVTCLVYVHGDVDCSINRTGLPSDTCAFDLKMKGAQPRRADQYLCSGYNVEEDITGVGPMQGNDNYIVRFEAIASASKAHHILVYGCSSVQRRTAPWACGSVCGSEGTEQILFAWAKNAAPLSLPKDVGRMIGKNANINYIVIQVHYVNALSAPDFSGIRLYFTQQKQPLIAGIYLMLSYSVSIPPNTPKTHADISCGFNWGTSIVPFGFRTHAHSLGQVISGYKENNGVYTMIGKGNPQWPQAFYPVTSNVVINPGDNLVARCTFNSTGRNRLTHIGSKSQDEMCNFYIMYYMKASEVNKKGPSDTCAGNNEQYLFQRIPADSDTPLPRNEALENDATGHHHSHNAPENEGKVGQKEAVAQSGDSELNIAESVIMEPHKPELVKPNSLDLKFISDFGQFEIGQVGGLAVNDAGELHIFHRGSRVWNSMSFDAFNNYQQKEYPVQTDAIIILNKDGTVKRKFGKNKYYLPHGLSLDKAGNIWLTDVALHQVFRIPFGKEEPDMTLGIKFEHGTDDEHFCKPSDVAVMPSGEFFVSDGYCNTRMMKFDKNGYFVKEWGSLGQKHGSSLPPPSTFHVPHSLTLAEDKNLVCVADRENGRIQCFDFEGNFVIQMHHESFGHSMYALEYCPKHGGILFAVNGPVIGPKDKETQGFTLDINTGKLLSTWNVPANGFTHPHDLTVDTERHLVYVGELNPKKVWQFEMSKYLYSVNTTKGKETAAHSVTVSSVESTGPQMPTENMSMTKKPPSVIDASVLTTPPHIDIVTVTAVPVVLPVAVVSNTDHLDAVIHKDTDTVESTVIFDEEEGESIAPSLIIGTLLVVPVVLLILITVLVRLYNTGHFQSCRKHRRGNRSKFNLGNLLNSHKGFDRLSTEDDDHDLDNALDDSDNEEFSIVRKA